MATGNETITLTSEKDKRSNQDKFPVWQRVITATHDADDTGDVTITEDINGILQTIIFTVPNYTNSITGQLVIKDDQGNTIYDSEEKTKATTYKVAVTEPLYGKCSFVLSISGAAGGTGGSMVVTLRGI